MKDPYVYEGTNVLINLANIKEQDKLDNFETTIDQFDKNVFIELINALLIECKNKGIKHIFLLQIKKNYYI